MEFNGVYACRQGTREFFRLLFAGVQAIQKVYSLKQNLLLVRFVVRHSFDVRLLEDVFIQELGTVLLYYCTTVP